MRPKTISFETICGNFERRDRHYRVTEDSDGRSSAGEKINW